MSRKLSIIIPVYQVEAYVGKTLASVFATNTPTDAFEVIVVNDGTKDRSMDVVRQFADQPNLIILEQENQGLSAARMKGLSMASGEYIWFVDSDDWLVEDGVGRVMDLLGRQCGVDVLMFPMMWVYEDGEKNRLDYQIEADMVVSGKSVIREKALPVWASPRFVFNKALLKNKYLFFPNGHFHEDEYFGPVLITCAERVLVLREPVYMYNIRSGSIMFSQTIRSSYDLVSLHKLLIRFMNENMNKEDKKWFRPYCFRLLRLVYEKLHTFSTNSEIRRFAYSNGFYVWRQWLKVFPEKTLKNKLGRLLYFVTPDVWTRFFSKAD